MAKKVKTTKGDDEKLVEALSKLDDALKKLLAKTKK